MRDPVSRSSIVALVERSAITAGAIFAIGWIAFLAGAIMWFELASA